MKNKYYAYIIRAELYPKDTERTLLHVLKNYSKFNSYIIIFSILLQFKI